MELIKKIMGEKHFSQRSVAEHLGISLSTFHRKLKNANLDLNHFRKIIQLLEITDDEVLEIIKSKGAS